MEDHAHMYCVIEDVEDNDPDKYKWWSTPVFLKKFNLIKWRLDRQLKKNGGISIDGTLYKKSPMHYIPKY